MANLNVLSDRYASSAMNAIFSEHGKTIAERDLWIAVMKAQQELGLDIPLEDIRKFEQTRENIDLERIRDIERITKHDVKAKIQAFVEAANAGEHIHKGMTSRDLTDNVEQMQIKRAAQLVFKKCVAILYQLLQKAQEYQNIVLAARTHHQPAQPTLLGRRMAMWAEEFYEHLKNFEQFIEHYPLRGMKGPVGTQFDMLTLLGSKENVQRFEKKVASQLGFTTMLDATGQIYPRSLDFQLTAHLVALGAACANYAHGMRLMAGYELATEGFKEGQVGSSSMPHKMNTRSSERIVGFVELLKMYNGGASRLAGNQWEEGDVSCSVVRRVVIPDALYAAEGMCETTLNVLQNMGVYPAMIEKETNKYLPFLATTEILMHAVQVGLGREEAHEVIKKHAVAEALYRKTTGTTRSLAEQLASDPVFQKAGITQEAIEKILSNKEHFIGNAKEQIAAVQKKAQALIDKYPEAAQYNPQDIL